MKVRREFNYHLIGFHPKDSERTGDKSFPEFGIDKIDYLVANREINVIKNL